jgi:hypothetical protein
MLVGLREELLESADDDDFESVVLVFEEDAYATVVDVVIKKVSITTIAAKKLPLVISHFLL